MYRFHTILLTHLNNWSNPLNITSLLHLEYDVRQLRSEQCIGTAELTELEKLKIQPVKFGIIHINSWPIWEIHWARLTLWLVSEMMMFPISTIKVLIVKVLRFPVRSWLQSQPAVALTSNFLTQRFRGRLTRSWRRHLLEPWSWREASEDGQWMWNSSPQVGTQMTCSYIF